MSYAGSWSVGRVALALALGCFLSPPVEAQIYKLAELNTDQIGNSIGTRPPSLPGESWSSTGPICHRSPTATQRTADRRSCDRNREAAGLGSGRLSDHPVGIGWANRIGGKHVFPGSYPIRTATLRAVFMDLATEFGEQGFRWIFVIHGHGSPNHNRGLEQAADYFRDTYGGHMVHLTGLQPGTSAAESVLASGVSKAALAEDGFSVHAGLVEHSRLMALRPDLVSAAVANAPSVTGKYFADLRRIAAGEKWPGYFGAPRHASPALGRRLVEEQNQRFVALALRILDGLDERQIPRASAMTAKLPELAAVADANTKQDAAIEEQQRQWLAKSGQR